MRNNFWSDYSVAVYGVPLGHFGDAPNTSTPPLDTADFDSEEDQ